MVLSTEWSQVEVIDLVNDGSGLGFGIVGGRSTGVVIKSILPGGIADRDGRLQSGDHILQINDVQTRGLASEHVATILRQCSTLEPVRMVVARSVDSTQCTALGSDAPIVPTKTLTDPDELETLLLQNGGYPTDIISQSQSDGDGDVEASSAAAAALSLRSEQHQTKIIDASYHPPIVLTNNNYNLEYHNQNQEDDEEVNDSVSRLLSSDNNSCCSSDSPESQTIHVHLEKNSYGLGITVAGYVWEREDLSGIFVKGISEGSAAHLTGQIHLNDRIVEVDGRSLRGVTNHEAVEMLRQTNVTVDLVLERYLRGPRYEHLLNALQADAPGAPGSTNNHISPPSPSVTTLSWFPADDNDTTDNIIIEPEPESHTTIDSLTDAFIDHDHAFTDRDRDPDTVEVFVDPHFESGSITPDLDMVVQKRWSSLLDDENTEIVVAQLRKLRGLGISLEGTVEVEDGIELRPRHFIRSILPEGPVGRNGKLNTGDELLEVNGQKLLGRNHVDVVKILKELPETVRIVCARQSEGRGGGGSGGGGMYNRCRIINTAQDREGFAARNLLSGSLRTLLNHDDDDDVDIVPDVPPPPPPPPAAAPSVPTDGIDEDHEQQESLNNTSSTATLADVSAVVDDVDVDVDVELESTNGTGYDDDLNNDSNVLIHVNDNDNDNDNDVIDLNQHEQHESIVKNESINENELNDLIESKYKEIETINEEIKELINNEVEEEEEEEAIKNQTNGLEHEEHEQEHCTPPKLTKMMIEQEEVTAPSVSVDDDDDNDSIVTYLAIWKQEIEWIELLKINNTKGLGFSILDYQDPLDPYGTVIVVRSLIPGGCASLNGRLHPGDRLMYVNDISFKNVTLQYAVQILKSIQPGHTVRIGFSKPMPLLKQHHQHQHQHKTTTTTSATSATASTTATTSLSIQDNYFIW
ncbi:patj homolog [Chrysoperla carnea]|uniref:patj homolog n=1 Tax=Chrysoperla carnea TaxID=189513 RepID=UPI001D0953BC|nr:patj homolog [Chrysoperla carnea]